MSLWDCTRRPISHSQGETPLVQDAGKLLVTSLKISLNKKIYFRNIRTVRGLLDTEGIKTNKSLVESSEIFQPDHTSLGE